LVLVSTKTLPKTDPSSGAIVEALATLLAESDLLVPDRMIFLRR